MEVTAGEYGRMIFEMMVGDRPGVPDHWKSIEAEAAPLVRQLLALNSKMVGGGYTIVGYTDENGKPVKGNLQRIQEAQERLWGVKPEDLQEGDRVWVVRGGIEMEAIYTDPETIEFVKGSRADRVVVIDRGRSGMYKIGSHDKILKAPDDWDEDAESRYDDSYWRARADELGI